MKKALVILLATAVTLWGDSFQLNRLTALDRNNAAVQLGATKNADGSYTLNTIGTGTDSITLNMAVASDNNNQRVRLSGTKNSDGTFSLAITPGVGFAFTSDVSANSHKLTNLANGTATGDAVNLGQISYKLANMAALRAFSVAGIATGQRASLLGYYTNGDGGGGDYYYNSDSSATDDGGGTIAPTVGSGRWIAIINDSVYNVRRWGAKGDAGTDDQAAINATIAAVKANGGGIVYSPKGIYRFVAAGAVLNTATNVTFMGAGFSATQWITGADGITLLSFTGVCSRLTVKDMWFGSGSGATRTTGTAINIVGTSGTHSDHMSLNKLMIQNMPTGVNAQYVDTCDVNWVHAFNNGALISSTNGFVLDTCIDWKMRDLVVSMVSPGVNWSSDAILVQNNCDTIAFDSSDCGHSNLSGFAFRSPTGSSGPRLVRLQKCYSESNGISGFEVADKCRDVRIDNCESANNTGDGYWVSAGTSVSITNSLSLQNQHHGINVTGGSGLRVQNNTCSNNSQAASVTYDGIAIGDNVTKAIVTGNRCGDFIFSLANKQRYGISTSATGTDYLTITENNLLDNTTGAANWGSTGTHNQIFGNPGTTTEIFGLATIDYSGLTAPRTFTMPDVPITGATGTGAFVLSIAPTVNGLTVDAGSLTLSGNQSLPAWTTSGARLKGITGTLTDTTSATGTVAKAYTNKLGGNTIAATNTGVIFTDYISLYASEPVAGTNVTLTNKWALGGDSLYVGTSNPVKITSTGVLSATNPVFTGLNASNLSTGTVPVAQQDPSLPRIVARSGDSTPMTSNAVLTPDDTLIVPVAANHTYWFQAWLQVNSANVTMDVKYGWTYPTNATMSWGTMTGSSNAGGFGWVATATSALTLINQTGALATGSAANATFGNVLVGTITTDATHGGNLTLQWAQNTSDPGALTLKAGSFIEYRQLY